MQGYIIVPHKIAAKNPKTLDDIAHLINNKIEPIIVHYSKPICPYGAVIYEVSNIGELKLLEIEWKRLFM